MIADVVRDRVRRVVQPVVKRRLMNGRFTSTAFEWRPVSDDMADVLMCLWNRKERLEDMLRLLDAQKDVSGVRLYLWNNQRRDDDYYRDVLARFEPRGALARVDYVTSPFNLGAMTRFYWAKKIADRRGSRPVIVVDDDEELHDDFVRIALDHYDPAAISAFWAFVITGPTYWDREFSIPGGRVDHIGPGGIVVDAALFQDTRFFTELPDKYWLLDDIWLTNFARRKGLELRKLPVEMEMVLDETNQYWGQLQLKVDFYQYVYGVPAPGAAAGGTTA